MKKIILSLFLLSSFVFAGCNATPEDNNTNPLTESESLSVVTSFYPLAFFTQQIAGDHAEVVNLSGTQSPHSYKISPQDRAKLEKADLLIYQGLGLESWTDDVIPELEEKNISILEASHQLSLLSTEEEHDDHDEEGHDDHEDEEMHADEDDHEEENHDEHNHGEFDPHTWLDPVLAQEIAKHIAEKLIEIDPQNTAEYLKNLEVLIQKLHTLDTQYISALANCRQTEALISHDAFAYLQARYKFSLHPIAGLSPSDEPSAKLLAELKEEVENEGVTHVLTEENNIQAYAQTIADETGLQMEPINTLGTTPKKGDYFTVSKDNISALSSAFQCQ